MCLVGTVVFDQHTELMFYDFTIYGRTGNAVTYKNVTTYVLIKQIELFYVKNKELL